MSTDEEPVRDEPTHEDDRGVYGISLAAELAGLAVPTLRLYEAHGLLRPDRTPGGTRRYSANDVARLRGIGQLVGDGVNLAGVARVLELERQNSALRRHCEEHHVDRGTGL
ncbi:MerR family transcriptional regulator [Ornithinimicrobium cerasi]|uniref:MerR HTH family regulatory protein n=1 Tax=Ornithinimicrobium cerasi TaxID=2248773 RepID=A0A285VGA5_9MICO|nr:MerR family transcriptional regulator [Ornithinimicrobium cerasi]SOC52598.1 MerR HTH family regulatory protein [Ornithinimicrobium cerasi]